ncbi:MAG: orotate phosphoribosyltransferase [Chloroflexota bacterium]|nr:orotate phosphoribosyltransferase [Chloroflexota bacterium]
MAQDVGRLFQETGAMLQGHFLLTSGRHSPTYLEKFLVLQYPSYTQRLCRLITRRFAGDSIQVVAGPTTGGIILAFEVARQLGVRGIFAETVGTGRAFRRGFAIAPGERVLVVDDVLTTGGSIRDVVAEVRRQGGHVVGIGVLVDRSAQGMDFGTPLFSCYRLSIPTYSPEECPLCKAGLPLTRPGGGGQGG